MARDYTKYNVKGLEENLNKRQLVYTVVKDWANKNTPSFDAIQKAFPDEVQGSKGFICKESEVKAPKLFNMREPIKIKNGALVVVSNQWGDNIKSFLSTATKLGYKIEEQSAENSDEINNSQEEFELAPDIWFDSIKSHIDKLIYSSEASQSSFSSSIIKFINENNEYYWWIPAINAHLHNWEVKIDDDQLDLSIDGLHCSGKNLDFNPYKKYRLFYNVREELFSADDDEPRSFFEAIIDSHYDFDDYSGIINLFNDTDSFDADKFVNLSKTVLYCTLCKECEHEIDPNDLADLMVGVNFENLREVNDEIMGGDIANEILEDIIASLHIDVEDFNDEENLWRNEYLTNYEEIAQELLDNDVFDNDYIPM